jgi:hypothetical protein
MSHNLDVPITVVNQDFQGSAPAAGKDKQRSIQRFALELLAAKSGQAINALAEIDRLDGQKNPHLGSDLDHGCLLQKACAKARTSRALPGARRKVILAPRPSSNSTR